jgi:hypothetical protein
MHVSPQKEPRKEATVIDLTLSDSEDEEDVSPKSNAKNKPDSSNQTLSSAAGSRFLANQQWEGRDWRTMRDNIVNFVYSTSNNIN